MERLAAIFHFGFDPFVNPAFGMWMFLSIGAVALFVVFIPTVSWIDGRRKEREAFYKADTLRRLTEATGDGAKAVIELLREEERMKAFKQREGLKIGGVVNVGVGIALVVFLRVFMGGNPVYLCGMIPGMVGVALLAYVFLLAEPKL